MKKHSILIGILLSVFLLLVAAWRYPGGSAINPHAVGFDWQHNFISNLFGQKALNGDPNPARFWAIGGMIFLSASYALFFVRFSTKIPPGGAVKVIRYCGVSGMFFTFLIATPLHDSMITIASTLFLVSLFYITVFVFKSPLTPFKLLCPVCLLFFYGTLYVYGSGTFWQWLPALQKATFVLTAAVVLGLDYFSTKKDFEPLSAAN